MTDLLALIQSLQDIHISMSFQLEADETLEAGLRRIAVELVDGASVSLAAAQDAPPGEFDAHIHSVRKTCKKMRGLLRLARASLGDKTYYRENIFYRDLSRSLAGARESHVLALALRGGIGGTGK